MNEKLEMAKNSLYNVNEIKDIKENPVVESVLLAPIKAIPVLGDLTTVARIPSPLYRDATEKVVVKSYI